MKLRFKIPAVVAGIAAVSTVIPAPAHKLCFLGYYAHCSWTPISTLICLIIAGAILWVGLKRS